MGHPGVHVDVQMSLTSYEIDVFKKAPRVGDLIDIDAFNVKRCHRIVMIVECRLLEHGIAQLMVLSTDDSGPDLFSLRRFLNSIQVLVHHDD